MADDFDKLMQKYGAAPSQVQKQSTNYTPDQYTGGSGNKASGDDDFDSLMRQYYVEPSPGMRTTLTDEGMQQAAETAKLKHEWNKLQDEWSEYTHGRGNRSYLREGMAEGSYQAGMAAANDQRTKTQKRIDKILGVDSSKVTGKKTDWGEIIRGTWYKGADQVSTSVARGLNFFFGDAAEQIHSLGIETINGIIGGVNSLTGSNIKPVENKGNLLTNWYETLKETKAHNEQVFSANVNTSKAAQIVDNFGTSFVAALPMAIEAFLLKPYYIAKAGATATTAGLQYLSGLQSARGVQAAGMMARQSMNKMLQNPQFWTSYIQAIGDSAENAEESGLSPSDAAIYTMINGFFNAVIEVGGGDETLGGIQNFPMRLQQLEAQGGKKAVVEWFKDSVLGEGLEEVEQGIVERGLKAPATGAKIASLDPNDTDAILNPWTSGQELTGGAFVGGLLGGGQMAVQNSMQTIQGNRAFEGDSQALLESAKKSGGETYARAIEQIEQSAKRDASGAVQLNRDQAAQLYDIIRNQGETGKYQEAVQEKRNGQLLTTVFSDAGIDLTEDEQASLTGLVNEGGAGVTERILGMRDAYKAGESGQMLADVMLEMEGRGLTFNQIAQAWKAGANVQTDMTGPVDVNTEDGRATLEANLAPLGTHIDAAVNAYDGKQDAARYSAAMQKAAFLYAANGADLAKIVQDARDGKVADIVGYLTDEQVKIAQDIGNEQRAQIREAEQTAAARTQELQEQAAAITKGQTVTTQALAEMDTAIDVANKASQRAVDTINQTVANLEAMAKANPKAAQTEAYKKAYDAAMQQKKKIEGLQKTVTELRHRKAELEGRKTIQRKKGTVSFAGGTVDKVKYDGVDQTKLTRQQKKVVAMVERLADAVNLDYVFISADPRMGGAYVRGGTVYININSGMGVGSFSQTMAAASLSHELTHWMQEYAPEQYRELKDFIVAEILKADPQELNRLVQQQQRWEKGRSLSYEQALDEVVANACQTMLLDSKAIAKLARQNMNLAERIRDFIEDWSNKIKEAFTEVDTSKGAIYDSLRAVEGSLDHIQELWDKGIEAAAQSYNAEQTVRATVAESATIENAAQNIGDEQMQNQTWDENANETVIDADGAGIAVDQEDGSAYVQYSRWTWEQSDYVQDRDDAAKELSKALGISQKKAKDYIDSVNSVAKMIADSKGRLDYDDTGLSPFVGNTEYGGSFDFTTLCKKRRLLTGTFSAIQNALANTALTANEILEIRKMMDDAGLEVSCGKCYVEGSRASMGLFTKEFLKLYEKYHPGAWVPNMAQMNTPDGIEWVRQTHPEVYEQYEYFWNHYGTLRPGDPNLFASQQKPKLYQMRSAYKGEVMKHFRNDGSIAEKNKNGGMRMQSFSDFEIVHLIDAMQVIMDMSRVGLNGQAYTKVPDFAWALGKTGLKINLSIDAWDVQDGKLIFNNKEGMNFDEAMRIRNANSENVGTICCVYDDAQLLAALADDRIDFIIPFHRSQWKKSQYKGMGLPATTKDYTYQQNEKWLNPKAHMHEYRGRQVPTRCTNYMPNEYWDFSKSGKENAEKYLQMCAEAGKRPKFYRFLTNNGDGSFSLKADGSTDGYWKLLIDFKMYDNDGKGAPQRPVRPDFNMEEIQRMLTTYEGGHQQFPVAQGVVDEFVKKYKARHPGQTQFQTWSDEDYSAAVERGDMETAQRMVDEAAEAAGYTIKAFHGTRSFGFTVFDPSKADDGISLFATSDRRTAETYSGVTDRNRIKDRVTKNADDLHGEELIEEARKYNKRYQEYSLMSDKDKDTVRESAKSSIDWSIRRAMEFVRDHNGAFDSDKSYIMDRLISSLYHLRDSETGTDISDAWSEWEDALWDLKGIDDSIAIEFLDDVDSRGLFQSKNELDDMTYQGDMYADWYMGGPDYLFDNQLQIELNAEYHKGIYELRCKPGKQLVIDSTGENWNQITPPKELQDYGLSGPQMTRAIASAAKALGYDSVLLRGLRDNGGETAYNGISDVYIFFDSNALKSADPVTYDDNDKVIPLSERFNSESNDIRYQQWGENGIDDSAKDGYNIETAANEIYNHLMEVLGYDTRDSGHWGQNNPAERQRLGRIERTYRESTVRSEKDRNELCDAVRQAGGIQQRRVNIGPDVQADLNIFDRQFYTAEMLHIEAANKARGIDTVFFVDDIVDEYGDRFSVNGFSDPDTKTVYVKYNAKNDKDSSVSDWHKLNGKAVARYEGVQTAAKNSRHERFHQLFDQNDKSAQALFRFVDNAKGKYTQYFDAANFWYQRTLRQDGYDFSDYSQEIAADLYAGTLLFDNEQIRKEVRRLVEGIDKGNMDTVSPNGVDKSVRFQRWDDTDGDNAAERNGREQSYARLQSENKILSNTIKGLNKLIAKKDTTIGQLQDRLKLNKTPEVREADAKKLARQLLREHNSIADFESVAAEIKALGDYLVQAKEVSEDEVKSMARNIAAEILENATEQYRMEDEQLDTVRGEIKGKKLTISPDFLGELDQAGGYDLFRRQNFGKFTLARADSKNINRDDYMSVSQFYTDMQNQYGKTYFPDAANEGEEAIILASVMQAADPIEVNPYRQYMGEATEELANRITQDALNGILRLEPDRYADAEYLKEKSRNEALNARVKQLVEENALSKEEAAKLWQQVHDLNTQLEHADLQYRALMNAAEDRIWQVRAEGIVREVMTKAKERERAAKNIQALKDHYKELQQNAKERRDESAGATKYRKQVFEKAKKLREMLLKNDDKTHVPEVLKAPLAAFLESLNFTSTRALRGGAETNADRAFAANLQKIQQILSNQQDYINGGEMQQDLGGYIDIGHDSMEFLRRVSEMITTALSDNREYTINQMSAAELKDLSNFLSNLRTAINNMNRFMANARFESVREAASADIQTIQELGRVDTTENGKLFHAAAWENGTPYYVFRRFGEGGKAIFDSLTRGWEKMAFNVQEIMDFTEKTYTSEEVRDWKKEAHAITLEDGSKITMTTAQIMEFTMLQNRQQATKHQSKGGMRIADIEGKKGITTDTRHHHLTDADIKGIVGLLTPRQAEVAKALQTFMAVKGAEWGNEISMRRFGYRFYTEGENYYPIKTDSNDRPMSDTDAQQNSMFRLLNLSASKSLNPKASNALVVGDIFDTFADHMSDMAKLNGMGLPILDAIKWFNFKERIDLDDGGYNTRTMQGAMEEAFGKQALSYFRTLMKDINGVTESGDRGTGFWSKLLSNYKAAAVGANLRVAFLQPTSYVRASYLIKPKYLLQAFTNKNAYKEAMANSGTAVWKDFGYYDTNIARGMRDKIKHNDGWRDKVVEKSMALAGFFDKVTWGRLWVACKMQTAAETGLQGEELKKKTADLFREVIYSSQVMDSTLTRSELMRGKSQYTKALTAFMAEPTLSYNMVMDAGMEYHMNARKYGKGEAWKRSRGYITKAISVYVCSAAFSAVVESIADAFRDDDDEEDFFIKWSQAMFGEGNLLSGNLAQDLSLFGKLPYIKNLMSALQGYKNKDMSTAALDSILDTYKIWKETIDLATGELDKPTKTTYYGNMTTWGKIYKTLQGISQLSGIAVANLTRDVTALWNTTVGAMYPEYKVKTYDPGPKKAIQDAYTSGRMSEEEAIQKLLESGTVEDEDKAYWTVRDWEGEDKYSQLKEAALNGDADTVKQELEQLTAHGVKEKTAISNLKSFLKKAYTGEELDKAESKILGDRQLTDSDVQKILTQFGGMDDNEAYLTVKGWETGDSGKYIAAQRAAFTGDQAAFKAEMQDLASHGVKEKDVRSAVKAFVRDAFMGKELSEEQSEIVGDHQLTEAEARKMLHYYAGLSVDEANKTVAGWKEDMRIAEKYGAEYEKYDLTTAQAKYFYEGDAKGKVTLSDYAKQLESYGMDRVKAYYGTDGWRQTGLTMDQYDKYATEASKCKGVDNDGDGKADANTVKNQKLAIINSLPVSPAVKDAIYRKNNWAESGLKNTPWH